MDYLRTLQRYIAKYIIDPRVLIAVAIIAFIIILMIKRPEPQKKDSGPVSAAEVDSKLLYSFSEDGTLEEAASIAESRSPYWWLDSGGEFLIAGGVGETIRGDLSKRNPWYKEYADTNPADTDGGLHPQNLLRLVSRSTWGNVRVEASYYILKDNRSESVNRNESNGLLIMSRYSDDGQTLYYAGVRVDGTAVIKKKYKGTYYTMEQKKIFPGSYDRDISANLLPHDAWIRLRSDTVTQKDGSVTIKLYMQDETPDHWKLLLSAKDDRQYDDTPPITGMHPVGLRTDFMDVKFDDILMEKLS